MISGEIFIFTLKISIANNCIIADFFDGWETNYLVQAKLKSLIGILINYTKGSFMDVVDFIIKTSTMAHPDYRTIIKL